LPNLSMFAFTATPKDKTLEIFGMKQEDGSFVPFSLYSMRQAIEERFILDVLENYTTYQVYWKLLKTIAAFLNTDGGDLLIGVADDKTIIGIEADRFDNEDKFLLHLSHVIGAALGDRSGTLVDAKMEAIQGKTVCLVICQRSPEPVFFKRKGIEEHEEGDFYVRSGPQTVKLDPENSEKYIQTRF